MDELKQAIDGIMARVSVAAERSGRKAADITVLAATKTRSADEINAATALGVRFIGENRVQELLSKYEGLDLTRAQLHFIGALQTNKVRQIIDKVSMIQSVDSLRLAREIDRQAGLHGLVMDILIEVNIGGELSKSGVAPDELDALLDEVTGFSNIRVRGLMAIPPILSDLGVLRGYFKQMKQLFIDIKGKNRDNDVINVLSMGMSGDFELAIEQGATLVRVGTAMFGARG